jgi:hypothetical protein
MRGKNNRKGKNFKEKKAVRNRYQCTVGEGKIILERGWEEGKHGFRTKYR